MTVGIYVRVSTEEQAREGYSISAQRKSLEAYCVSQGWKDYAFYADMGVSAKNTERPQLQKLMTDIKKREINTVLVYRLDRFTRSVLDLYKMLEVLEEHECTFKSATEMYDTGSAMGRLFITLVAAMAQWERENLGERVRIGQIEKFSQGGYSALAPFGYDKIDDKLHINKNQSKVLLDMIDRIEKGYSTRQVADYLNESEHKPVRGYKWHSTSILNMLKNPVLYGAIQWGEQIKEHTHEPLISKERFNKIIQMLNDRRNVKYRKVNSLFVYQMKIICPVCQNHLTSERYQYEKKDGTIKENNRYRCQVCAVNKRPPVSTSEKNIEQAFINYIKDVKVNGIYKNETDNNEAERLDNEMKSVEDKREKYQRGWANGWIKDEEFERLMRETDEDLNKLIEDKQRLSPRKKEIDKDKLSELAKSISENYLHLKASEKKEFLNIAVRSIAFDFRDEFSEGRKGKTKRTREMWVTNVDFY